MSDGFKFTSFVVDEPGTSPELDCFVLDKTDCILLKGNQVDRECEETLFKLKVCTGDEVDVLKNIDEVGRVDNFDDIGEKTDEYFEDNSGDRVNDSFCEATEDIADDITDDVTRKVIDDITLEVIEDIMFDFNDDVIDVSIEDDLSCKTDVVPVFHCADTIRKQKG
eukprot:gene6782-12351_t